MQTRRSDAAAVIFIVVFSGFAILWPTEFLFLFAAVQIVQFVVFPVVLLVSAFLINAKGDLQIDFKSPGPLKPLVQIWICGLVCLIGMYFCLLAPIAMEALFPGWRTA